MPKAKTSLPRKTLTFTFDPDEALAKAARIKLPKDWKRQVVRKRKPAR